MKKLSQKNVLRYRKEIIIGLLKRKIKLIPSKKSYLKIHLMRVKEKANGTMV